MTTIGEFTNVPEPLAPINSAWAQTLSGRVVHRFTDATARDAAWPAATAGDGAMCYLTASNTLCLSDGTGWIIAYEPAQAFTPVLGSWVLGTGGSAGSTGVYQRSLTWCSFEASLTLGTSGFTVSGFNFTLPKAALGVKGNQLQCEFLDFGGLRYNGHVGSGTTTVGLYAVTTNATYAAIDAVTATVPFTWAASDSVSISGRYRISAYT